MVYCKKYVKGIILPFPNNLIDAMIVLINVIYEKSIVIFKLIYMGIGREKILKILWTRYLLSQINRKFFNIDEKK